MCFVKFPADGAKQYIVVSTKDKADIIWDGERTADIQLPEEFKTKTEGLCGTFNDDILDEFTDNDGQVQETIYAFANTFIDNDCVSDPVTPEPCNNSVEADQMCSKLEENVFSAGHSVVGSSSFKTLCMNDVCASPPELRDQMMCAMLTRYSRQCALNNVVLNWRAPNLCRKYHNYRRKVLKASEVIISSQTH